MRLTPEFFLSLAQTSVLLGFAYYWIILALADEKFTARGYCRSLIVSLVSAFIRQVYPVPPMWIFILSMALTFAGYGFFVSDKWGWDGARLSIYITICVFSMEIMFGVFITVAPPFFKEHMIDFVKPLDCFLVNIMSILAMMINAAAVRGFRKLRRKRGTRAKVKKRRYWPMYLRLALLLSTSLSLVYGTFRNFQEAYYREYITDYMYSLISLLPLVGVGAYYFVQDIRYIGQLQRNETLEYQQGVSNALLKNLRFFRHNLINMLYGFEGAILSGDKGSVEQYYREMAEKCMMINNENIVALQRVGSIPVSALLLRHIDAAQACGIPINLYVQDNTTLSKRMKESDFIEVAGALLDNAVEAAKLARAKYMAVELRNVDEGCELLIRNTVADDFDPTLLSGGTSDKEGHQGIGIKSCEAILKKYPKAFLNLRMAGQYVETQLVM